MVKEGTFTSVWDNGHTVTSKCKVNIETMEVFDIETVYVDGLDILEREYITIDGKQYPVSESRENDGGYWYN